MLNNYMRSVHKWDINKVRHAGKIRFLKGSIYTKRLKKAHALKNRKCTTITTWVGLKSIVFRCEEMKEKHPISYGSPLPIHYKDLSGNDWELIHNKHNVHYSLWLTVQPRESQSASEAAGIVTHRWERTELLHLAQPDCSCCCIRFAITTAPRAGVNCTAMLAWEATRCFQMQQLNKFRLQNLLWA